MTSPCILGTWPTPMEPAPRLAVRLGLRPDDLWIKRDDLGGLGGGGNKIRKLEFTCADALDHGATMLITSGAAQGNHARLTAAAAARDQGQVPYVVPFGGSSFLAAQGYVLAAREILTQLPDVENVVVAVGSGRTMAGLVAHLGVRHVFGVDVGAVPDAAARVSHLISGMDRDRVSAQELHMVGDQIGAGYDSVTPGARQALQLAAQTEGIFLDPTYTARALAGLAGLVLSGAITVEHRTVFMHTGGLPALFGHSQVRELLA